MIYVSCNSQYHVCAHRATISMNNYTGSRCLNCASRRGLVALVALRFRPSPQHTTTSTHHHYSKKNNNKKQERKPTNPLNKTTPPLTPDPSPPRPPPSPQPTPSHCTIRDLPLRARTSAIDKKRAAEPSKQQRPPVHARTTPAKSSAKPTTEFRKKWCGGAEFGNLTCSPPRSARGPFRAQVG